ncbi:rhamnogalacturonan acetylesterase [Croceibacterium sp. TMG7-5b_MA50]|uniref:rhamnogalacturonan acetylesterase n=1 Tax=Croceibacterium sp. TMG7-5b_MA50 TaxID=3121290 RepID=UPI003221B916
MRLTTIMAAALALAVSGGAAAQEARAPTLFIASDSTAQHYNDDRYPQAGWGSFLGCVLTGATVDNRAIGGRSTRTFVSEGRWNGLLADLRPGDAVLIQFGHNDASENKPERFADAATTYRQFLMSFIADVRAAGATPVLLTPVARRSFDESGKAKADFPTYSAVVRQLAEARGVPLVDLETSSRALLDQTGYDAAAALYLHYPAGEIARWPEGVSDDTHFSEIGARRIANLVADGLTATPLAPYVGSDRSDLTRETPVGSSRCR